MITENVEVNYAYLNDKWLFLGYLPVLDSEYLACSYYSVPNIHPTKEYDRVVPCYLVPHEWPTETEEFFLRETLDKDTRENIKIYHELYRDLYIDNFNTKKMLIRFVGCDDGDKVYRVKDFDDAMLFLNSVSFFEEVYNNDMLMVY